MSYCLIVLVRKSSDFRPCEQKSLQSYCKFAEQPNLLGVKFGYMHSFYLGFEIGKYYKKRVTTTGIHIVLVDNETIKAP